MPTQAYKGSQQGCSVLTWNTMTSETPPADLGPSQDSQLPAWRTVEPTLH